MIKEFNLELKKREELGKQAVKRLRKDGNIPGVFYSSKGEPIPFTIDKKHLHQAFLSDSHVYALEVGGKKLHAIFKDVQYHPVTDDIIHVDLYGISMKDKINITVPVLIEGDAAGVKVGGILTQTIMELEIACLATEVPDAIHIDITEMELGAIIHAEDVDLGGRELVTNPEIVVASLQAPRAADMEIEAPEEEVEVEDEDIEDAGTADESKDEGDSE